MVPAVDVFTNSPTTGKVKVATCRFNLRRGQVTCAFSYDDAYLASPGAYAIDPALPLNSATYHCDGMPGALRDSTPDRWGRHLIDRQASYAAGVHSGTRRLDEVDYLLGVHDQARQGALRFALPGNDAYESCEGEVPPVVQLKSLLHAANEIAAGNDGKSQKYGMRQPS